MKQFHMIISGKVQGVFFRANTREKAKQLGLVGYVMNLSNGKVETVAQGPEDKLNELVEFCQHGQTSAEVDSIELKESEPKEKYTNFEIRF